MTRPGSFWTNASESYNKLVFTNLPNISNMIRNVITKLQQTCFYKPAKYLKHDQKRDQSYNKLVFTNLPNISNMIRSVIKVTTNLFLQTCQISQTWSKAWSQSYNKLVFTNLPNISNMIRNVITKVQQTCFYEPGEVPPTWWHGRLQILLYGAKILLRQARS